jgi:hypothetical protein
MKPEVLRQSGGESLTEHLQLLSETSVMNDFTQRPADAPKIEWSVA